tara:strand:+ start:288 stop:593 length:306 start_codon:yes stop_codon:yes gene_type:complete
MEIYGIELEILLGVLGATAAAALWGMKKYQALNADGKITLDEIIGAAEEGEKFADDIIDAVEDLEKALLAKKKAELIALAKEKGLATTGTKADLVQRLTGE